MWSRQKVARMLEHLGAVHGRRAHVSVRLSKTSADNEGLGYGKASQGTLIQQLSQQATRDLVPSVYSDLPFYFMLDTFPR